MQIPLKTIILIALLPFLAACANTMAQPRIVAPQDVAREFWTAMVSKNIAKAKTFAKADTRDEVGANDETAIEKINLQPSKKKDGRIIVPTLMLGIKDGRRQTLSFDTVLIQEIGEWKVDFVKTSASMRDDEDREAANGDSAGGGKQR
ncbi:MAG: hypothetical protein ACU837_03090 [Gammaproteobacteria bacterium]